MYKVNYLQIRSQSIISYNQYANGGNKSGSKHSFVNSNGERIQTYSGTITKGAKKRLTKAVSLLVQSTPTRQVYNRWLQRRQKFKITFITLTVSSADKMLSAKEAHAVLLEPMLRWLRRNQQMRSYVWKAELQERGQIHYHITADCYVDLTSLREQWNNLQSKAGLLEGFFKKYGHRNPNSTDIKSVKKVNNMEAYIVKYISKSNQNGVGTIGKIWDCSKNLKEGKYYVTITSNYSQAKIENGISKGFIEAYYGEQFAIFKIKKGTVYEVLSETEQTSYKEHLLSIRTYKSG